jgi:hypothetical protein
MSDIFAVCVCGGGLYLKVNGGAKADERKAKEEAVFEECNDLYTSSDRQTQPTPMPGYVEDARPTADHDVIAR